MKITWLGQAGWLFEVDGIKVLIDPYLSNSVAKIQPHNYRRQPIKENFLRLKPDVIVLTHNHADHTDEETLKHYLNDDSNVLVLASYNAWNEVRKFGGLKNNYVMFNNGTTWTLKNIVFQAVYAEHSDHYAIGVIITVNAKHYYITGDTLYSEKVLNSLPAVDYEMCFFPVNGKGNNMNFADAKHFAEKVNAKNSVPMHFGMFDEIDIQNFDCINKLIFNLYEEKIL